MPHMNGSLVLLLRIEQSTSERPLGRREKAVRHRRRSVHHNLSTRPLSPFGQTRGPPSPLPPKVSLGIERALAVPSRPGPGPQVTHLWTRPPHVSALVKS